MRSILVAGIVLCAAALAGAQTADELVAKNIAARGGLEKIKAISSVKMSGRLVEGGFVVQIVNEAKRPEFLREDATIQGMTQIQAYDGSTGWQISPFQGRKDPELLGEDDLRGMSEDADFDGPLVDYQKKGNTVEYLGHDIVDGDDALKLKVTLKNGDIIYYFLDPDTFIEIRTDKLMFVRGAMQETVTDLGSFKPVNGVMYPFSVESGPKNNPGARARITFEKIEANVALEDSLFTMPGAAANTNAVKPPSEPPKNPPPNKPQPPEKPKSNDTVPH
jgi:hypothetical protein